MCVLLKWLAVDPQSTEHREDPQQLNHNNKDWQLNNGQREMEK